MRLLALLLFAPYALAADLSVENTVTGAKDRVPAAVSAPANTDSAVLGMLHILHRDDFKHGDYRVVVRTDDGKAVETGLAQIPPQLRRGWKVIAYGQRKGAKLAANRIQVLAQTAAIAPAKGSVLVTLVNFAGKTEPFTQASVQAEWAKVAAYYQEASFGKQTLAVTVTPWLQTNLSTSAAPVSNCDFSSIHNAAEAASSAQGYNPAAYQFRFFVWPGINCGWLGLGYVGYGEAYSNGSNVITTYGHELGHNLGLYHAGKLNCASTMTNCSVSEYGDPRNVMGNISAGHINGMQKALLTWIPPSAVQTHPLGTTADYTLHAIEGPQGNAVKIAESAKRTYWVEYRQPYGFDTASGVFLYVSSPFETVCQTCGNDTLLVAQVTPAQPYTDSTITITVGPATNPPAPPPPPNPPAGAQFSPPLASVTDARDGHVYALSATATGSGGKVIMRDGKLWTGSAVLLEYAVTSAFPAGNLFCKNSAGTWFSLLPTRDGWHNLGAVGP